MARVTELVFKGNNRSAIRALTEIADKSGRTSSQLKADSRKSTSSFNEVGKSAGRLHGMVSGLAAGIGLGGLAFGFKDAVHGGIELQTQQEQLRAALKATGDASEATYTRLADAAEKLSTHGGFTTPANLTALAAFTRETHDSSKAVGMLSLATNIARGRNIDLGSAQMIVQRAYTGTVGRLQALLGPMVATKDAAYGLTQAHKQQAISLAAQAKAMGAAGPAWLKQQDIIHGITPQMRDLATLQDKHATATMVMAAAQRQFAGATDTYSKTTAGRLSNVSHSVQNLKDAIGKGLLPIINKLVPVITSVVTWLNKHRIVLYGLFAAIGVVVSILTAHALITEVVKAKTIALAAAQRLLGVSAGEAAVGEGGATAATTGLGLAMDALPILAVIAGIVLLVTHFKLVEKAAVSAWKWIKGAAADAFGWIKQHWPLILGILTGPFGLAVLFVVQHFDQIKHLASSVVGFVGRIFSKVWGAITWPFREGWKVIQGIFHGIVSAARWVVDKVKGLFHFLGHNPITDAIGLSGSGGLIHGFGLFHSHGGLIGPAPKYLARGGPAGTDTVHAMLTPGEYVLDKATTSRVGVGALQRLQAGGGGDVHVTVTPQPVTLKVDSRTLAETVVRYTVGRAARGPSSLVGGSFAMGSATA